MRMPLPKPKGVPPRPAVAPAVGGKGTSLRGAPPTVPPEPKPTPAPADGSGEAGAKAKATTA
eukprot:14683039-Alexandrium_andersonii.AAC.1